MIHATYLSSALYPTNKDVIYELVITVTVFLPQNKDAPTAQMREVLETYKPHILTMRRRLIEDCCRDLRLNNDHIHIVEQQMRAAIEQGLSDIGHGAASVKCFPT